MQNTNFDLLMIVNDPDIANYVVKHGVARLFIDLEYMGKADRQKGMNTWQSTQKPDDISKIRNGAPDSHIMVRINPLHDNSKDEINDAISRGCQSIMLPMFRHLDTLKRFYDLVNDRVDCIPLAETASAINLVPEMIEKLPIKFLHIGLNDLHLDLGCNFIFEPLANGFLERACVALREHKIRFGIGGLARAGEGIIPPDYLLGEHVRLGSTATILSRSFHRNAEDLASLKNEMDFPAEIIRLREIYARFLKCDALALAQNRLEIKKRIMNMASVRSRSEK